MLINKNPLRTSEINKPEGQGRRMTRSKQACDSLSEEQHPVSFGNKGPEQIRKQRQLRKIQKESAK